MKKNSFLKIIALIAISILLSIIINLIFEKLGDDDISLNDYVFDAFVSGFIGFIIPKIGNIRIDKKNKQSQ